MWLTRNTLCMIESAETIRMYAAYNLLCVTALYFFRHLAPFLRVIFLLRVKHFVDVVEPLCLRDGPSNFYRVHWWPIVKSFY